MYGVDRTMQQDGAVDLHHRFCRTVALHDLFRINISDHESIGNALIQCIKLRYAGGQFIFKVPALRNIIVGADHLQRRSCFIIQDNRAGFDMMDIS